ncbi:MAG TPA: putative peptidoglycan glycosyltransferase FtsW [Candidatus Paceibacterota bacterium]
MNNRTSSRPDTIFTILTVTLIVVGIFVFTSASFGLGIEKGIWGSILFSQLVLGLCEGLLLASLAVFIPRYLLQKYAFYILLITLVINLLVFVPDLGFNYGGATRWIHVVGISFQPSELLKLVLVIFLSAWLSRIKNDVRDFRYGFLPFICIAVIIGGIMIAQPDTGTYLIMLGTALIMFFSAGAKMTHILAIFVITIFLLIILILTRPYVKSRIIVFFNPTQDPTGESYQIQQALLAIGSGELTGKGFGQSVQKFQYLPEPIGDSIFAVLGEEFGFVGTLSVVLLFVVYCLRGLHIASWAKNSFDRLLVTGLVIMTSIQAFMNIGATIGLLPITGVPLPFISHGGTALMFTLISAGLVLNVSRTNKPL